ncbi:serine hydrolase domain-containing protein [Caulobacter sp. KR2-114]|uniref:serine hydrolase domain-containing protein n=1 Tax=Caulobacter sp. KR2-114 TaxID=3400912 RepID=UPI003BFDA319
MADAAALQAILQAGVAAGHAPGMTAALAGPEGVIQAAAGVRGADNASAMTEDTVVWIASLTKAVTSAAAMQLVEQGRVGLDDPVARWLPRLAEPQVLEGFGDDGAPQLRAARAPVTLRHLLTHTSGLAYDFFSADLVRYLQATGASLMGAEDPDIPLLFEPGAGWQYGISTDWVGKLVEAVSGERLDAYVEAHICGPLGMADTTFSPGERQNTRRASVHQRLPDGSLLPIPFAMPPVPYFAMGGGGLYSTAGDYLTFLRALLAGGGPILRPETVAQMGRNQIGPLGAGALKTSNPALSNDYEPMAGAPKGWGLGFLINHDPRPAGRGAASLAWAGLANCYYWLDPAAGRAGVLMSQVLPFADAGVLSTFDAVEALAYA